jgi:predicted DNA-binding transcriptional regulator
MNNLEVDIGRQYGASCFFIYQVIKSHSEIDLIALEAETGMSHRQIRDHVKSMVSYQILTRKLVVIGGIRRYMYSVNEDKQEWKLH